MEYSSSVYSVGVVLLGIAGVLMILFIVGVIGGQPNSSRGRSGGGGSGGGSGGGGGGSSWGPYWWHGGQANGSGMLY